MGCYRQVIDYMEISLSNKIKREFKAVADSALLYGRPTGSLTKRLEKKKLDGNYAKIIMEAAPHKTVAVLPFAFYLTNHSSKLNKICWPPLEK